MINNCGFPVSGAGDTTVTDSLRDLARGSDLLILQNMGPIADFGALSYESQYLLNVSASHFLLSTSGGHVLRTASPDICPWHTVNS